MQAFTLQLHETYIDPSKVYTSFNSLQRTNYNIIVEIND